MSRALTSLRTSLLTSHSKMLVVEIAILLLLPGLLYLINQSWTFLPANGGIDPYIYTGFFRSLSEYLRNYPTYQGSRLPWLLLGNGVYTLADPNTANLILRLLLFYAGAFSMFILVYALWRKGLAALAAAMMFSVNVYFLMAIRTDYITGPGVVSLLLILTFIALSRESRLWWIELVLAGVFVTIAVSINLFLVILLPIIGLWLALVFYSKRPVSHWIAGTGSAAVGAVGTFAFFALINHQLTDRFNYLQLQIDAAKQLNLQQYYAPDYSWLSSAGWLLFPVMATFISLAVLPIGAYWYLRNRRLNEAQYFTLVVAIQMIAISALFVFFQVSHRGAVLQLEHYVAYLMPFAFLVIGSIFALTEEHFTLTPKVFAVALSLLILLLLYPLEVSGARVLSCAQGCPMDGTLGVLPLAAVLVLVLSLIVATGTQKLAVLTVAVLLISLVNVNGGERIFLSETETTSALEHSRFELVYAIDDLVWPYNKGGNLYYWYHRSDQLGPVYQAAASLRLWYPRILSDTFPTLKNPVLDKDNVVPVGQPIVILSDRPDAMAKATEQVQQAGLGLRLMDQRELNAGSDHVVAYIVQATPGGEEIPVSLLQMTPIAGTVLPSGPGNGVYDGIGAFPSKHLGDNYWVDVVFDESSNPADCGGSSSYGLFTTSSGEPQITSRAEDPGAYELGVGFRSRSAGFVCSIRFFRGTGNEGPHLVHLWGSDGTRLAESRSVNETQIGWQTVPLYPAIRIEPNRQYVASYSAPKGHYAWDQGFFLQQSVSSGSLNASMSQAYRVVTTPNVTYGYGASLPIPQVNAEKGYVHVRASMQEGVAGFCVLNRAQNACLDQQPIADKGSTDIYLSVEHLSDAGSIIVRTWNSPRPGKVEIETVGIVIPAGTGLTPAGG